MFSSYLIDSWFHKITCKVIENMTGLPSPSVSTESKWVIILLVCSEIWRALLLSKNWRLTWHSLGWSLTFSLWHRLVMYQDHHLHQEFLTLTSRKWDTWSTSSLIFFYLRLTPMLQHHHFLHPPKNCRSPEVNKKFRSNGK